MVDDLCFIRSMHTEAINHEPAITLHADRQPGDRPAVPGRVGVVRPGLAQRQPADVRRDGRPADEHRAGAGDLGAAVVERAICRASTRACRFRTAGDPILYINDPPGVPRDVRRATLDGLKALNELNYQQVGDPETHTRIQQYELAFRMQASVPELTDIASEPEATFKLYGDDGQEARHVRQHGAAGAADGRARRAVRADLPQQLGHARQRRRPAARSVPRRRSAVLRPDSGPQAARHVRRDARHLGRRVRPHDLLAGRPLEAELRPRPSSALLHDVDGRRRRQGRHDLRRDGRLLATTSSKTRSTSATSTPRCCTCSASTTSGSSTATRDSTSASPASSRRVIPELLA